MSPKAYIDIETVSYRGMSYTVSICNPAADWGSRSGKFTSSTKLVVDTEHYDSLDEAKVEINKKIDEWADTMPSTLNGFIDLIEKCMVWTGYEDCELDRDEVGRVLLKYREWNRATEQSRATKKSMGDE